MPSRDDTLSLLVAHARENDAVLALFVFGSRGRKVATDDASDYDVAVILRDDAALTMFDKQWPYAHGAGVEIVSATLDDLLGVIDESNDVFLRPLLSIGLAPFHPRLIYADEEPASMFESVPPVLDLLPRDLQPHR
jgi:predicted nucleotidyltransferase